MSTSPVASTVSDISGTINTASVTEFVATSNQTTFTVDYTVGEILVFLNGVLLDNGVDYTATNGTFSGNLSRCIATSKQSPKSMCTIRPLILSSIRFARCLSPSPRI